jgi:hypothetical protein
MPCLLHDINGHLIIEMRMSEVDTSPSEHW